MGNCLTTGTAVAAATSSRGHARWRRDRGRRGSSAPASALVREQDLHLVPGRIFSNDGNGRASAANASSIYTQQGRKGINQDSMIIWEDFGGGGGILCGVFDGHGPQGHLVARKVRDALPLKLLSSLPGGANPAGGVGCCPVLTPPPRPRRVAEEEKEEPSPVHSWRQAFVRSYKAVDKELRSHPSLDCFCSGSTAVIVLKLGSDLFMGNIGDSRAVLGSKDDGNGSMVAVQLTVDLKPDLPREAERIKRCRGRVFALQDEPEVQRVWLPFDDAPGLAMARAFGDFCLKDYGVISVPDFSHWSLTERDQFVVLASDGVWDVLTNQEVVDIVSSSSTRSSAAKFLVDAATHEWKLKYPTSKMDDCTVVCLYLDGKMDSDSVSTGNNYSTAVYHDDGCHTNGPREESSEEAQSYEPYLDRNFTMRALGSSGVPPPVEGQKGASGVTEDQNWLGLEAVTRVNSLVQLPRFSDEDVTV